jgi:hypothetical protein
MRVLSELEGGEPWSHRAASILARQSQWSAYGTQEPRVLVDLGTAGFLATTDQEPPSGKPGPNR